MVDEEKKDDFNGEDEDLDDEDEEEPSSMKKKEGDEGEESDEKIEEEKVDEPKIHHIVHKSPEDPKEGDAVLFSKGILWGLIGLLAVLLVVAVWTDGFSGLTGATVSNPLDADEAKGRAEDFINTYLLDGGMDANVGDAELEKGLYKFEVEVGGRTEDVYMSQDGDILFTSAVDINEFIEDYEDMQENNGPPEEPPVDIPKSDKPEVELFVMSHCPYGTQAEKGIIPVVEALGEDIDFNLRFVYYAMHGETEVNEQLNQYCIQKEQKDKFLDYLKCFLADSNGERCLTETGIDMNALTSCTEATDTEFEVTANLEDESKWLSGRFPMFNIDKDLNDQYGIGGSPSLVINGVQSNAGRDPASYLDAICDAFNEESLQCDKAFSSEAPSPGFGAGTASGGATGSCG